MAEFTRNNGRSESGSAEGSAAVGQIPRGIVPAAVRETPAAAVGMARDIAAEHQTNLREGASPDLGVTGRGGTALPFEVGPPRGQPDQPGRTGEWGAYPGGELDGGFDLPLSRHLAFKHTPVPSFSGLKPEFNSWTRDARYYAKGVGFLSAFVSDPPQYIPVGELDTENSMLVARGFSRESVHVHTLAWNFLSTALKSKSDKSILHRCTSPRRAWDRGGVHGAPLRRTHRLGCFGPPPRGRGGVHGAPLRRTHRLWCFVAGLAVTASSFDVGQTSATCPRPLHPMHSFTVQFATLWPFLPHLKHLPAKVLPSAVLALLPLPPAVAVESPPDSPRLRYGPLSPALPGWSS